MKKLSLFCATTALVMPATVMAQSTGSQEVEEEIVITGTRTNDGVDGIVVPDATKSKGVLTQEIIARQGAGQTILNTINLLPSVNFTQSDAYGSSGGNIRIRGFDGNRISLTFDGKHSRLVKQHAAPIAAGGSSFPASSVRTGEDRITSRPLGDSGFSDPRHEMLAVHVAGCRRTGALLFPCCPAGPRTGRLARRWTGEGERASFA